MIVVRADLCTGCGVCLEVCPTGALYLVEGKAAVDRALCRECRACLEVCPTGAITLATQEEFVKEETRVPAIRPQPEVIQVRSTPAPVSVWSRVLPSIGSALVWAERDLLPWLADFLDRREQGNPQLPTKNGASSRNDFDFRANSGGSQRQRRQRRRGGG